MSPPRRSTLPNVLQSALERLRSRVRPGTRREHSSCGTDATTLALNTSTLSLKGCSTALAWASGCWMRRKPLAATSASMAVLSAAAGAAPATVSASPISTWGVPAHSVTSPLASKLTFSSPTTCEYSQACTRQTRLPSLFCNTVG
ncbi:hypothetical protein D3C71_1224650 [compost metagenome]